jgi:hypothetical protein
VFQPRHMDRDPVTFAFETTFDLVVLIADDMCAGDDVL